MKITIPGAFRVVKLYGGDFEIRMNIKNLCDNSIRISEPITEKSLKDCLEEIDWEHTPVERLEWHKSNAKPADALAGLFVQYDLEIHFQSQEDKMYFEMKYM